jgi:hypothetical protein
MDPGSSWGRRNNRKSALTWPEKKIKKSQQQASNKLDT